MMSRNDPVQLGIYGFWNRKSYSPDVGGTVLSLLGMTTPGQAV